MLPSLLLPALFAFDVSLAGLFMLSYEEMTTADSCAGVGDWVNGTCWEIEQMQAVVASALLAVSDFNSRNVGALPALGTVSACDKQLQMRLLDSGGSVTKSVQALGDLSSGTDVVIGPGRSSVSFYTAAITGAYELPQISYWSTSIDLSNTEKFPRFMRTIPSDHAPASDICSFWKHELGLSTVAVLYLQDPYGRTYEEVARAECQSLGLAFFSSGFSDADSIWSAVTSLSNSNAKAVLAVTFPPSLDLIVAAALQTGLLSAGTSWVFPDSVTAAELDMVSDEGRAALNGSFIIKAVGATDNNPQWTRFSNERWAKLQPAQFNPHLPADWQIRDDFFRDPHVSSWVPSGGTFAYDAIMAAGLLSCQVAPTGELPVKFGTQFWESKHTLSFEGLSGRVEFDEKGDRSRANVHLFNLLLLDQRGFSEKDIARFSNGKWIWQGGSREGSGVVYNFGKDEPPFEPMPPPPPLPSRDDGDDDLIQGIVVGASVFGACFVLILLCFGVMRLRRKRPADVVPKDEIHRMQSEITEVFRCMSGNFNAEEVTLTNILDSYDRFASAPRELVFGRPAQAALGVENFMRVPDNIVHQGRIDGTAALVSEARADCGSHPPLYSLTLAASYAGKPCRDGRRQGVPRLRPLRRGGLERPHLSRRPQARL